MSGAEAQAGTVDSLPFNGADAEPIEADITFAGRSDDLRAGETVRLSRAPEQAKCAASEAGATPVANAASLILMVGSGLLALVSAAVPRDRSRG